MRLRHLIPNVLVLAVLASCDPGDDPLSVTSVDDLTTQEDVLPGPGIVGVFVTADFTATEDIVGFHWPAGSDATLEVDYGNDGSIDFSRTSTVGAGGEARFRDYTPGEVIPFAATTEGDRVTITGAVGSATHIVPYIAFGWADSNSDLVCGYARSGAEVGVRVFSTFPDGTDGTATADATETWCAGLGSYDLVPGDWGWAFIHNGGGNTLLHWYSTQPPLIRIDIRPGADPNSLNCHATAQVLSVAILTIPSFDATTVDHATVTFEGASEVHVDKRTGEPRRHVEDVDGDGDMDLVFHFRLGDTALGCDATAGRLEGETYDGTAIVGADRLKMIG